MNRFPQEIVHRILEYDGRIKYRHGKYINQFARDDVRYRLFDTIPVPKYYSGIDGFCNQIDFTIGYSLYWGSFQGTNPKFVQYRFIKVLHEEIYDFM